MSRRRSSLSSTSRWPKWARQVASWRTWGTSTPQGLAATHPLPLWLLSWAQLPAKRTVTGVPSGTASRAPSARSTWTCRTLEPPLRVSSSAARAPWVHVPTSLWAAERSLWQVAWQWASSQRCRTGCGHLPVHTRTTSASGLGLLSSGARPPSWWQAARRQPACEPGPRRLTACPVSPAARGSAPPVGETTCAARSGHVALAACRREVEVHVGAVASGWAGVKCLVVSSAVRLCLSACAPCVTSLSPALQAPVVP